MVWIDTTGLLVGLVALVAGASLFLRGANALGQRWRLPPAVLGLTVVALGTSSPELAVTLGAVWSGSPDVGLGNVVGSNVANLLLILGAAALFSRLPVARSVLRFDLPTMVGVTLLTALLAFDGKLSPTDGGALLLLFLAYGFVRLRGSSSDASQDQTAPESGAISALRLAAGLAVLVGASSLVVGSASGLARAIGIPELAIGATVVAVGTSLPELATSLVAMFRRQYDLVLGNAIGSNVLNLVLVAGASSLLSGSGLIVNQQALQIHIPLLVAITLLCIPLLMTSRSIARLEGLLMLTGYAAYAIVVFGRMG